LLDRSKESTQTKRDALVLQVGGWVDGPTPHHPKKNIHAKKPRQRGRRKIAQNSIKVDAKTKESTRKTEEKLDGRNEEGHERKKPVVELSGGMLAKDGLCLILLLSF
jgi:hypothetical protein